MIYFKFFRQNTIPHYVKIAGGDRQTALELALIKLKSYLPKQFSYQEITGMDWEDALDTCERAMFHRLV